MENNTSNTSNPIYERILFIFEYIRLIIGVIGFIGNVLSIIIFSRRSLSKYSYSFYSRAMAISDVFLAFCCLIDWIGYNFGAHLEALGPFFCKIFEFMAFYFAGFSIHMLTIISIDRMLTIVYHRRFLYTKKRWFQFLMIGIVACAMVLTCILVPLSFNLVEVNQANFSQPIHICLIASDILNIEMWIITINFIIVNIIINNLLNFKTIRFIMESRKRVMNENENRKSISSLLTRDRKFAFCSVCLNLSSMSFKLPFFLSIIIVSYSNRSPDEIFFINKVTGTINNMENGFSFFINLFVNSLFYNEFLRLIRLRKLPSTNSV